MARKSGLKSALEGLGIVETTGGDDETTTEEATPLPVTPASTPVSAPQNGSADKKMVRKIREAVTSSAHSPRIASFLEQLEKANAAFPNDPKNAVVAAIAFSSLTAKDIREDFDRSVAAALVEAETNIKTDIASQREAQAKTLDDEANGLAANIEELEGQLADIQRRLTDARGAHAKISTRRATAEAEISARETTAMASLAAVRTEMDSIKSLLP